MQNIQRGVKASDGIAIGKIVNLYKRQEQECETREVTIEDHERDIHRDLFKIAVEQSSQELSSLAETNEIFAAQVEMVNDPMLLESVEAYIEANLSALSALQKTKNDLVTLFENIEDTYLRERVADVKDICNRIAGHLSGNKSQKNNIDIEEGSIIIAEELMPSDTSEMDMSKIGGFITAKGGLTSHFCIIARNRSIPTIIGFGDEIENLVNGDLLILDANETRIIINPDQETIATYESKIASKKKELEQLESLKGIRVITTSGEKIDILANAGSVEEVKLAISKGAEGIGLFRSEFLFMNSSDFPSEEEQFTVYKEAALACQEYPLTIRTLDIGGDKELPYYKIGIEENPALGLRAIRFSFAKQDIFKTQLRAILRASAHSNIKIMFPMIISVEELELAIKLVNDCKAELTEENKPFNPKTQMGIMIETPASVFIADELIQLCDFFSIGTNDLTQYILAVDRGNATIGHLYNSMHPAVLNAINKVIDIAKKNDKDISMCGDLASNPEALKALLKMGLTKYSVSINSILKIKEKSLHIIKHEL